MLECLTAGMTADEISGVRKNREDCHWAGPVEIDASVTSTRAGERVQVESIEKRRGAGAMGLPSGWDRRLPVNPR